MLCGIDTFVAQVGLKVVESQVKNQHYIQEYYDILRQGSLSFPARKCIRVWGRSWGETDSTTVHGEGNSL